MRVLVLAALAVVTLSGCSSMFAIGNDDFGCKGMPDGMMCQSARDVYHQTNNGNVPLPMHPKKENSTEESHQEATVTNVSNNQGRAYIAPTLDEGPTPIRTPAKIMRIWVAPWQSKDGDLNVPGYVYTEIEHRRWVIGNDQAESSPTVFHPLQTVSATKKHK